MGLGIYPSNRNMTNCIPNANDRSSGETDLKTIISRGICVTATVAVMKKRTIINGKRVLHGVSLHAPGVTLAPPAPEWNHSCNYVSNTYNKYVYDGHCKWRWVTEINNVNKYIYLHVHCFKFTEHPAWKKITKVSLNLIPPGIHWRNRCYTWKYFNNIKYFLFHLLILTSNAVRLQLMHINVLSRTCLC